MRRLVIKKTYRGLTYRRLVSWRIPAGGERSREQPSPHQMVKKIALIFLKQNNCTFSKWTTQKKNPVKLVF